MTLTTVTPKEQERMDAPLLALASQSNGDLRKLLYAFFSFLHRRTDFYCVPNQDDAKEGVPLRMGFQEGDAEKLLLAAFRQFPLRRMPRQGGPSGGKSRPTGVSSAAAPANTRAAVSDGSGGTAACEVPATEGGESTSKGVSPAQEPSEAQTSSPPSSEKRPSAAEAEGGAKQKADATAGVRRTDDGKQIPVGNGGTTPKYTWTQTLEETTVLLGVPEGTRGKDLDVRIAPSCLKIRRKADDEVLLEGDLVAKVRTDESTWSLEGGVLVVTLDKLQHTWWDTVIQGDDVIDTSLVDSTRRIDTYDDATQGAIRKILFDQRQERLGLPTSDELSGAKKSIPPLPQGVEYIDKETLDAADAGS